MTQLTENMTVMVQNMMLQVTKTSVTLAAVGGGTGGGLVFCKIWGL